MAMHAMAVAVAQRGALLNNRMTTLDDITAEAVHLALRLTQPPLAQF